MKDRAVDANAARFAQGLLGGAKKPAAKLRPAISVFNLLVVFHVVADQEIRALALPQAAADSLLGALSNNAKTPAILHLTDHVSGRCAKKLVNSKFSTDVVVFSEFFNDVAKLLSAAILRRTNEDHVVARTKKNFRENVNSGEARRLSMIAWSDDFTGRCATCVKRPGFAMKGGRGTGGVITRRDESSCEGLDKISGETHWSHWVAGIMGR